MFASRLSIELFSNVDVSLNVTGTTKGLPKTAARLVVFTPEIDSELVPLMSASAAVSFVSCVAEIDNEEPLVRLTELIFKLLVCMLSIALATFVAESLTEIEVTCVYPIVEVMLLVGTADSVRE